MTWFKRLEDNSELISARSARDESQWYGHLTRACVRPPRCRSRWKKKGQAETEMGGQHC